ncbi:hypothetical protein GUJ93_ZPchr0002g25685 [Zizania palustris]|uniref:Glucose-6-phosphate 1-epimerase n=1 Tax=Zizania palustris TaxID=103762 RepID=A0A8J5SJ57_ZIZPA|nr:hypothetical protein GUJ93_ZPchr0002g25685 [Zizania palustris]
MLAPSLLLRALGKAPPSTEVSAPLLPRSQAEMAAPCALTLPSPLSVSSSSPRRSRRSGVVAMASVGQKVYAPGVAVSEGNGGLPKIDIKSPHGSEAEIYLFGACVTSWKVPNGKDLLFVRPDAVFNGQKPISGGIPHCFPQFGPGPMQQHGFARNMNWSITDSEVIEGDPAVTLELKDDSYSRSMWDFSFQALYKVALHSTSLSTTLKITNTDDKPFSFNSALHSYIRVNCSFVKETKSYSFTKHIIVLVLTSILAVQASISGVSVKGLKGCKTLNKDPDPTNPLEGKEERSVCILVNQSIFISDDTSLFIYSI